MKYESTIHQFLYIYRFFSFAIAVMLTQVIPSALLEARAFQTYLILTILGIYTLLKVLSPIRWRQKDPMTYIVLGGDLFLCILLVLFTGGLSSSFLLYSLTPIITAALLFEEKVALSMAAVASLSLSISYLTFGQFNMKFSWIMQGFNLTLLILYTLFSFVIASLTYRTNLNVRRRIERDAIIEERRRIGREIHDGVAQALSYLNMKTKLVRDSIASNDTNQALSGLDDVRRTVNDTYENIRESIDQLSIDIRGFPLILTLSQYFKEFTEKNNIPIYFDAPRELHGLSLVAELQFLRIFQEALSNVRKHSQATEVLVKVEDDRNEVRMIVKDNGQGLPPGWERYIKEPKVYRGLNIMKERAESLGGVLTILTAPGSGTEIRVSLPIEKVRI